MSGSDGRPRARRARRSICHAPPPLPLRINPSLNPNPNPTNLARGEVLEEVGDHFVDGQPVRVQERVVVADGVETKADVLSLQARRRVRTHKGLDRSLLAFDLLLDLCPAFSLVGEDLLGGRVNEGIVEQPAGGEGEKGREVDKKVSEEVEQMGHQGRRTTTEACPRRESHESRAGGGGERSRTRCQSPVITHRKPSFSSKRA